MIQRIQTFYLFLVAGLFFTLFFLPLVHIQSGDVIYSFKVTGLYSLVSPGELGFSTWSLLVITIIILCLSILSIFKFKKRVLQIRLCIYNALLIAGFCLLFGFYLWQFKRSPEFPDMIIHFRFWCCFPLIALILDYLAIRSIGVDEAMVRSLDRLR